ncbi:MAG TPA: hypothetical protein VFZ91_02100 [Allosphingosinicella sp.]
MEDPAPGPEQSSTIAKWSEALGQAILLAAIAWALFALMQAPWYTATFDAQPLRAKWVAVTFLIGAVPPLAVLLFVFLTSWLIGAVTGRADPWRSYRDGLILACAFTVLGNFAFWFLRSP